jgi:hypothetical protein
VVCELAVTKKSLQTAAVAGLHLRIGDAGDGLLTLVNRTAGPTTEANSVSIVSVEIPVGSVVRVGWRRNRVVLDENGAFVATAAAAVGTVCGFRVAGAAPVGTPDILLSNTWTYQTMLVAAGQTFHMGATGGASVSIDVRRPDNTIRVSTDGITPPQVRVNPRVIDLIGGGNVENSLKLLNMTRFTEFLAMINLVASAHNDTNVFVMLNAHYVNVLQPTDPAANPAATLDAQVADSPLKDPYFWLDMNTYSGVSKPVRQELWRLFYRIAQDQLTSTKLDGTTQRFLFE